MEFVFNFTLISTDLQKACVDGCCYKHINGNQRMMSSFMKIQTLKQKQMMEDAEKQQAELMEQQQQQHAAAQQATDSQLTENSTLPSPTDDTDT